MPRKFFKKYLPSHDSIKQNRLISFFGELLHHPNLWHLHRRSVAGGVAAGMFAGLIPGSNPIQFFFAALFSIFFRVNLPVAALTTLYSNPFTIVPLYMTAYALGGFVMGNGNVSLSLFELNLMDMEFSDWMTAVTAWLASFGKPLITGLFLLAFILSVIGYFLILGIWRLYVINAWHNRAKRHRYDQ